MTPHKTNDPKHWHERAAQMRLLALSIKDDEVTTLMNDLADDYDKMADRAAQRANGEMPK
jgi:hypothetical protein